MEIDYEILSAKIGAKMLESGAEIFRVEDTVKRILSFSGARQINVFCISSLLIVKTERKELIIRVENADINLFEIERLNSLSRAICENRGFAHQKNRYSLPLKIFGIILATGSFCLYFGGSIYDAIFSGIAGVFISFFPSLVDSFFSKNLISSALAGLLAFSFGAIFKGLSPDCIMIGTIMLLVPGLTISNSIRDIMTSDILSGIIELIEAIFTALAIALGFAFSVVIFI